MSCTPYALHFNNLRPVHSMHYILLSCILYTLCITFYYPVSCTHYALHFTNLRPVHTMHYILLTCVHPMHKILKKFLLITFPLQKKFPFYRVTRLIHNCTLKSFYWSIICRLYPCFYLKLMVFLYVFHDCRISCFRNNRETNKIKHF